MNIDYSVPTSYSLFTFWTSIILFVICYYYSYIKGYLISSIFMGLLTWNFAGSLLHDHGAHKVNVKKNNKFGQLVMSILSNLTYPGTFEPLFMRGHYAHHSSVHDKDLDADDNFMYPIMRWNREKRLLWFHKYQHIYYPVALAFYLFIYLAHTTLKKNSINWYNHHQFRSAIGKKFYLLFLLFLFNHIFVPIFNLGTLIGFRQNFIFLLTYSMGGIFFATMPHFLSLKYSVDNKNKDWAYNVVATSGDYLVGDWLANYVGALNVHGLHHLFPQIHPSHLESIYHIYEKKCKKFNYPIIKVDTWKEVFSSYHNTLYLLGNFE